MIMRQLCAVLPINMKIKYQDYYSEKSPEEVKAMLKIES